MLEEFEKFEPWIKTTASGNRELEALLRNCAERFLSRHSCVFIEEPGPGYRGLVRMFRGIAVITGDGLVRSSELFHVRNIRSFAADPVERAYAIRQASWDDRASLFAQKQPPRQTREAPPILDFDGTNCLRLLPDMYRQFEFLLNSDLFNHPFESQLLDETVHARGAVVTKYGAHRTLKAEYREGLMAALRSSVQNAAPRALAAFRDCLDQNILNALTRSGANEVGAYNWLCGYEMSETCSDLARNRTQAVTAYPIAWHLLSDRRSRIQDVIRDGEPLTTALSAALGIPENMIRRLNGLGHAEANLTSPPEISGLKRIATKVARMPKGKAPQSQEGWHSYFEAISLVDAVASFQARTPDGEDLHDSLLRSGAGKWSELDADAIGQAAHGFPDMVADFHANVCSPVARELGIGHWSTGKTVELLAGGRDLSQVAATSAWWHDNQIDLRVNLSTRFPIPGEFMGVREWPSLLKGENRWRATNGLVVVPLTNEEMLNDEHRRLGHCINGYAPNALFGGSHLLSVRSADDKDTIGTIEICQERVLPLVKSASEPPDAPLMSLPPSVAQFRTRGNRAPVPAGWEALWEFVSGIMTGAIEVDKDYLEKDLARRMETRSAQVRRSTSYDDGTHEAIFEAWRLYSPMLPKSVVRRGPKHLKKMMEGNFTAPKKAREPRPEAPSMGMGA